MADDLLTRQAAFRNVLEARGYTSYFADRGLVVNHDGGVDLSDVREIPDGVWFENNGALDLSSLQVMPLSTKIRNKGLVFKHPNVWTGPHFAWENQGEVHNAPPAQSVLSANRYALGVMCFLAGAGLMAALFLMGGIDNALQGL